MHKRFVQAHEGVRAAGMPHAALGRIAVVTDPDVGMQLLQFVREHDFLAIRNEFECQQVFAVAEHEGPLLAQ